MDWTYIVSVIPHSMHNFRHQWSLGCHSYVISWHIGILGSLQAYKKYLPSRFAWGLVVGMLLHFTQFWPCCTGERAHTSIIGSKYNIYSTLHQNSMVNTVGVGSSTNKARVWFKSSWRNLISCSIFPPKHLVTLQRFEVMKYVQWLPYGWLRKKNSKDPGPYTWTMSI